MRIMRTNFYSRPCERGDAVKGFTSAKRPYFYSRPCERGDGLSRLQRMQAVNFYSRPCERGDFSSASASPLPPNFYSRPCERGDGRLYCDFCIGFYFYSRPCERGDWNEAVRMIVLHPISTHAPARGATRRRDVPAQRPNDFYSRPCERGDHRSRKRSKGANRFLLTLLREGRRSRRRAARPHPYFYSRPCERGDDMLGKRFWNGTTISTHAPARGATILRADDLCHRCIHFYSRPCERGDQPLRALRADGAGFLLTPLREGRPTSSIRIHE